MKLLPSTVINFHAVNNRSWFEKTLLVLSNIYSIVSFNELNDFYYNQAELKHACHLTFDDGDKSFYDIVYPVLLKHGIPASIYISPLATIKNENFWFQEIVDYKEDLLKSITLQVARLNCNVCNVPIDLTAKALLKKMPLSVIWESIEYYQKKTKTSPKRGVNLSLNQVIELNESGLITIGAHTQRHPILCNETESVAASEILDSISGLSEILGKEVHCFAYPNGQPGLDFGEREKKTLADSPIRIAFSTESRAISSADDRLNVPRNGISSGGRGFIIFKLTAGSKWRQIKKLLCGKQEADLRLKSMIC